MKKIFLILSACLLSYSAQATDRQFSELPINQRTLPGVGEDPAIVSAKSNVKGTPETTVVIQQFGKTESTTIELMNLPRETHLGILCYMQEPRDLVCIAHVSHYWNTATLEINEGSVFVMGPARSGKSSLVHLLVGEQLIAQQNIVCMPGVFNLIAKNELPTVKIVHGRAAGTPIPCSLYDKCHKRFIWERPGFEDPKDTEQDLKNALATHNLLKGNVKIMLVVDDSDCSNDYRFLRAISNMPKIFPKQEGLKKCLFLIKQGESVELSKFLRGMLMSGRRLIAMDGERAKAWHINENGLDLIEFFINNPDHTAIFNQPKQEGPYCISDSLRKLMENKTYVDNPKVNSTDEWQIKSWGQ